MGEPLGVAYFISRKIQHLIFFPPDKLSISPTCTEHTGGLRRVKKEYHSYYIFIFLYYFHFHDLISANYKHEKKFKLQKTINKKQEKHVMKTKYQKFPFAILTNQLNTTDVKMFPHVISPIFLSFFMFSSVSPD